jgi:hypothetical protein
MRRKLHAIWAGANTPVRIPLDNVWAVRPDETGALAIYAHRPGAPISISIPIVIATGAEFDSSTSVRANRRRASPEGS